MVATKTSQKPKKLFQNWEDQIERPRDFLGGAARVAVDTIKEETEEFTRTALEQFLDLKRSAQKLSGELKVGEELDVAQIEKTQVREPQAPEFKEQALPAIDYHREFKPLRETYRVVQEDTRQIKLRIEQILVELRRLTSSSQELTVQFEEVTMEEAPAKPGTYHLSFFEWVFSVIRKARERIEESQTWLALFKSKRQERQYWNMFKKHGTMFGLSSERVVATQTG